MRYFSEKINSTLFFFDSNVTYGSNFEFMKTKNSSFLPIDFYPRLFDGKVSRTDVIYFWADKKLQCVHIYLKKMIFIESVAIKVHESKF